MAFCSFVWKDYRSMDQTISELSAIDAPSRSTWIPIGFLYAALLIAFGVGVWKCAREHRRLRVAAALLVAMGPFRIGLRCTCVGTPRRSPTCCTPRSGRSCP